MKKIVFSLAILVIVSALVLLFFPNKVQEIIKNQPPKIGVLPFGNISEQEVDSVKTAVEDMFAIETVVLEKQPLPDMAYTEIRYPRYRADSLLRWLAEYKPDSVTIVLGLTNKDISITKYKENTREIKDPEWKYKDFGIFGLGAVNGTACVVSSNRLHKNVSDRKFYKRLTRIACHEVGHVLGLRHCPEKQCLMNDANESIKTIDRSTGELCQNCWDAIQ